MKFLAQTAVTLFGCLAVQYFLPWWTLALVAFGAGYYFHHKGLASFAAGFTGVAVLWLAMAYYLDSATASILAARVGKLFPVNVYVLLVLVGGLVGGLAALTGTLMRGKKPARY